MSTALIPNLILGISVFTAIVGAVAWAIATAHRDHHTQFGRAADRFGWPRAGSRAN
jgi:hypothetical protein